jgi:hypothetical protein
VTTDDIADVLVLILVGDGTGRLKFLDDLLRVLLSLGGGVRVGW